MNRTTKLILLSAATIAYVGVIGVIMVVLVVSAAFADWGGFSSRALVGLTIEIVILIVSIVFGIWGYKKLHSKLGLTDALPKRRATIPLVIALVILIVILFITMSDSDASQAIRDFLPKIFRAVDRGLAL